MSSCRTNDVPQVFEFESKQVRSVLGADGSPWFVASDVCRALGLKNGRQAVTRLSPDERNTVLIADGIRGNPNLTVISEPGVYRLIFTSRVEKAEAFKRWLAHDVLPSIRKTGAYILPMESIRQAVAERFLRSGLAKWVKRFPDAFYQEIFRLRGWSWQGPGTPRPSVVAHYTNDLVYERLAPELLRMLQERNPINEVTGRRGAKHHQHLSDDVGAPGLDRHLHSVICIMRSSICWDDFSIQMDRIHPRWAHNLQLPLLDDLRLLPPGGSA